MVVASDTNTSSPTMLKLTIQGIEALDLFDTGSLMSLQHPGVIFKIGGGEYATGRQVDAGLNASFPEVFEINVDKSDYNAATEITAEVFNISSSGGKLHVGVGKIVLKESVSLEGTWHDIVIPLTNIKKKMQLGRVQAKFKLEVPGASVAPAAPAAVASTEPAAAASVAAVPEGKLLIKRIAFRNLKNIEIMGSMDLYGKVSLGSTEVKTSVMSDIVSNADFSGLSLSVDVTSTSSTSLEVSAWAQSIIRDSMVGRGVVDLNKVFNTANSEVELTCVLMDKTGDSGKAAVTLQFVPSGSVAAIAAAPAEPAFSGRLMVTKIACTGLTKVDLVNENRPFVTVQMATAKFKTEPSSGSDVTFGPLECGFNITSETILTDLLKVSVFNNGGVSDSIIGAGEVSLKRFNTDDSAELQINLARAGKAAGKLTLWVEIKRGAPHVAVAAGPGPTPVAKTLIKLSEGAKVEANYRGKGKWYPGKIKRDRGDATYDIEFDDGESETRVIGDMIRLLPAAASAAANGAAVGAGKFKEDDKVEANYRGKGRFYRGRVKKDHGDGTYDVDYDDGEKETRVDAALIREVFVPPPSHYATKLEENAKIEGNYRGKGRWYCGRISKDHGDNTYDLHYDDGEQETKVTVEFVRLVAAPVAIPAGKLEEGVAVEGNYRGRGRWFPGKISKNNGDNTFDIAYEDGEKETKVLVDLIRLLPAPSAAAAVEAPAVSEAPAAATAAPSAGKLEEGAKVEGNYRGKGRWYPGVIKRDRGDGTYDIDYNDGEQETRLTAEFVRIIGAVAAAPVTATAAPATGKLEEGAKVEANYRGKGKWYPGVIKRDRGDGTFDVDYNDGEQETRVASDYVRLIGGAAVVATAAAAASTSSGKLEEGAKVEANYRGKGKWYPGKIKRDRGDGTYDVDYNDGESETRVDPINIRLVEVVTHSPSPVAKARIEEGSKVEANFRGKGKYYPGKIKRDRGDGTFDVDYDDGEQETRVDESMIRLIGGGTSVKRSNSPRKPRIEEGSKVEANYRGKGKWFPGKVKQLRLDGTYDINYDDGEQETRVAEDLIRLRADRSNSPPASKALIEEGAKVEGNYRGKGKWYAGKVKQVRLDGTYDINYDDGEQETRVNRDMVRLIGETSTKRSVSPPAARKARIEEGSKVEANFRGKGKYYPGKIKRDRGDGTFDVDYNDGEQETRVDESLIRLLDAPVSPKATAVRGGGFEEGTKVEANYRGKGRWYKARVKRDRGDGTFDIDYDDGEKETRVETSLIRLLDAPVSPKATAVHGGGFEEGTKVEANYRGKGKWFPGKIKRDRGDGTFDIDYDDGEKEIRVDDSMIRHAGPAPKKEPQTIESTEIPAVGKPEIGLKVEVNYRNKGMWYPGKVKAEGRDGSYEIDYDDGENEKGVHPSFIRVVESEPFAFPEYNNESERPLVGSRVDFGRIRDALVKTVHESGRLDILVGIDTHVNVHPSKVIVKEQKPAPISTEPLAVGAQVEGNYRNKGRFYPGVITRVRADNCYDIDYDDGEQESSVAREQIRAVVKTVVEPTETPAVGKPEVDMKVEADYRHKGRWYPAKVKADCGDGTYDIDYDDGENEKGVHPSWIRVNGSEPFAFPVYKTDEEKPEVGTVITKYAMSHVAYLRGCSVKKIHEDGRLDFDIRNQSFVRVHPSYVILQPPSVEKPATSGGAFAGKLHVGDKVVAIYRNKGRFFPGKIKRDRLDGTFDVDYDDGEQETRVMESMIRKLGGGEAASSDRDKPRLVDGMKVEANYRGKGKYFAGRIKRDRGDGTFDIDYDDGEQETRVDASLIRKLETARSPFRRSAAIREGDKVEANYRGKGKWYKARVKRDRGDGTFDVDYDDGEQETRVDESMIRSLDAATSPVARQGRLEEGAKVEGNYRGRGRFYPGRIVRDRHDGTFDIDYDDGEKETRVSKDMIRVVGGESMSRDSPPARKPRMEEGSKVEANFGGKGKYYSGKIKRDRGDGTFDIHYDDGELETRVDESMIRLILSRDRPPARKPRLMEGDKVEADYRGKGKYYSGRIKRDRGDGTFDVDYDDGEQETRVDERMIRPKESSVPASPVRHGASGRIEEGAKVEGNFRGRGKWYPGRVQRDRGDGTFDIAYDDGELELRVDESLVRSTGSRIQKALLTSKELELPAMESMIASLQEKNVAMAEQLRHLVDEVTHMKSREADMMALIKAQGNMLASLMKK